MEHLEHIKWLGYLAIILVCGRVFANVFDRLRLSAVVGEIVAGVILLNCFNILPTEEVFVLSEIGVMLMMLVVGLETRLKQMLHVGKTALLAALFGVVVPFGATYLLTLAWGDAYGLDRMPTRLFLSAVMVATSIAVTARVFLDLKATQSRLSRTILAAAVIDDVLGLLTLTVVVAAIQAGGSHGGENATLLEQGLKVGLFLFVLIPLLGYALPRLLKGLQRVRGEGSTFVMVLSLVFGIAWVAEAAGLAAIVGVFLLGAILASTKIQEMLLKDLKPLYWFLSPVFFIYAGMQVEIDKLGSVIVFGIVLCLVAVVTKIAGGIFGSLAAGEGTKRGVAIGLGMVPRGEVGLIIATIGYTTMVNGDRVLGAELFAASALMCVVTILVVPAPLRIMTKRWPELLAGGKDDGEEAMETDDLAATHEIL